MWPVIGDAQPGPGTGEARQRRAWIAAHHPDRGGDPALFAAALTAEAWRTPVEHTDRQQPEAPITAYRRGGPAARLRRLTRLTRRRRLERRRRHQRRVV